jgi:arsenate reductase (glutaredoxin)
VSYILIHNPGCGSSKKGLELLQSRGVAVTVRKYMTERLSEAELRDIAAKMGAGPRAFLRPKDAEEAGVTDAQSDDEIFALMAANPKIIQRPIGINNGKAVLGRPNDALLTIL